MCGRYTISSPGDVVAEVFSLDAPPELAARWNVAPTQHVPVVRVPAPGAPRELALVRWGLVPAWAKDAAIGNRLINARAETLAEKPAFRGPLKRQRCLVVADGFYEWKPEGKRKQPWLFRRGDGRPFGIAGLWSRWTDPATGDLESCTLVTTTPNAVLAPVHDRMPAIVDREQFALWLDPAISDVARLLPLLAPAPDDLLRGFPVGLAVNNPAHDRPECAAPLAPS